MTEKMLDQNQSSLFSLNKENPDASIFQKIKAAQSLPDEVVIKFLQSKGKLKRKSAINNLKTDEK